MHTIIKWALRGYLLYKTLKIVSLASSQTPHENVRAAMDAANTARKTLMKIQNTASASINPAATDARHASRARATTGIRTAAGAATALLGAAGTAAMQVGDWTLTQDEGGNLIASADDGTTRTVAHRDHAPTPEGPADAEGSSK